MSLLLTGQLSGVETKVDTVDTNVDSIKTTVENTNGDTDVLRTRLTAARGNYLDNLNTYLDAPVGIRQVEIVTGTLTATDGQNDDTLTTTLTDITKAFVIPTARIASRVNSASITAHLTSTTNLRVMAGTSQGAGVIYDIDYVCYVIEFYPAPS